MEQKDIAEILDTLKKRIGFETSPIIIEVEKGMIRKFVQATGDKNPIYVDEAYARRTRFGGIVAPPTFVSCFTDKHFPEIVEQDLPFARMLHSDDIVTNHRLMRPGDVITTFARYTEAYSRNSSKGPMLFQAANLILRDAANAPVADIRIVTVSF